MNVDKFPGWRFGPDGQQGLFETEDEVPEGWTDNPNDFNAAPAAPAQQKPETPVASKYSTMTKVEVIKELEARQPKITFNKNWAEKKLIQLLEADDKKKGR